MTGTPGGRPGYVPDGFTGNLTAERQLRSQGPSHRDPSEVREH